MEKSHTDDIQFNAGGMIVDLKYHRIGILMDRSKVVSAVGKACAVSAYGAPAYAWKITWTHAHNHVILVDRVLGRQADHICTEWLMHNNIKEGIYQYYANE